MARALHIVINSMDRWWVDFEGRATGPFETIQQAAVEAQAIARVTARETGRIAEVLAPDASGKYWVVWTSARDGAPKALEFLTGQAA
ncbi:hypothetical protein SAMN02983003_0360 [Devosia enhydra]|uniref:DUF2188 domain-containing protein n=1 Tax=Devosia enhydra TaxID=665118 RepID=A0A1K2HT14_9HYPH|nr:hypothetical protein [Devosia enhydra]SFZ81181.1 hypothetical protein SAMN02983003_0360 [Devosia enhydra]